MQRFNGKPMSDVTHDDERRPPRSARCPSCSVTSPASPAPSAIRAPDWPSSRSLDRSRSPRSPDLSSSRPLIVTCPTGTMAGQLADDLRQFLPGRRRRPVPGVGDAAVRAGQPERRDDGPAARGAVAAARPRARARRSSSPACGRCCRSSARARPRSSRSSCARRRDRPRRAVGGRSSSSATAARSSSSTAASSPVAARSSTCTRRPPTPRSASTCGATRSTG